MYRYCVSILIRRKAIAETLYFRVFILYKSLRTVWNCKTESYADIIEEHSQCELSFKQIALFVTYTTAMIVWNR